MALTDQERTQISNGLNRYWSRLYDPIPILRDDVKAAVDATDTYIESIQATYNASLPDAARNNLPTAQKTLIFCAVALARVSMQTLKRVFTEAE